MKSIKLFYMGQRLRDVYPHATRFQVLKWRITQFLKRLLRLFTLGTIASLILVATYTAGQYSTPAHVVAETKEQSYAVLERIYKCESNNNHYDKNGQVLLRANTNKTVDVGIAQINSVWFAKATELGLDITKEQDNKRMAEWIYFNRGTGDWESSAKCWNK